MPFPGGPVTALNFPAKCARICGKHGSASGKGRALDIGCAVGASSFELAREYDEVVGIDFSQHFVDAANTMKTKGVMQFSSLVRGQVFRTCETALDQSIDRRKVTFRQGDACNMSADLGKRATTSSGRCLLMQLTCSVDSARTITSIVLHTIPSQFLAITVSQVRLTQSSHPICCAVSPTHGSFYPTFRGSSSLAAAWCWYPRTPGWKSTLPSTSGWAPQKLYRILRRRLCAL